MKAVALTIGVGVLCAACGEALPSTAPLSPSPAPERARPRPSSSRASAQEPDQSPTHSPDASAAKDDDDSTARAGTAPGVGPRRSLIPERAR